MEYIRPDSKAGAVNLKTANQQLTRKTAYLSPLSNYTLEVTWSHSLV